MSKRNKINNLLNQKEDDKPTQAYQGIDDDVFAALDGDQVSSDLLSIMDIHPDHTQPRRIVPREIRGSWAGHPKGWANIIQIWEEHIFDAGYELPIIDILRSKVNLHDFMSDDLVLNRFLHLLELAAQIKDVGLQQRIGVAKRGNVYRIIYGERRWSAFHLLNHYLGDDYASIPSRIASVSEWELTKMQAQENVRLELNAIGKARQFAKLLMAANEKDGNYDSWQALVVDGGCDRPYYAQVANGDLHSIPYGLGAQFEQAMGISTAQMRQYRKLLKLTEDYEIDNILWTLADENDWAEQFMRQIPQHLEGKTINEILRSVTTVTVLESAKHVEEMLREAIEASKAAKPKPKKSAPVETDDDEPVDLGMRERYLNQYVRLDDGSVGIVASVPNEYTLVIEVNGKELEPIAVSPDHVLSILNKAAYLLAIGASSEDDSSKDEWSRQAGGGRITYDDTVITPSGRRGKVSGPNAQNKKMVDIEYSDGHTKPYYPSVLTLVKESEPEDVVDPLLNKAVMVGGGVTGVIVHAEGVHIRVRRHDTGNILHTYRSDIVDFLEEDEGSDKASSTLPDTASKWVGKAAVLIRDGQQIPVLVAATASANEVIVSDGDGHRVRVNVNELEPVSEAGKAQSIDADNHKLAIASGTNVRLIISTLSGLAAALDNPDVKHKLQGLNDLTAKQVQNMAAERKLAEYLTAADIAIQEVVNYILVATSDALTEIERYSNE